jgi:hypothetical protein
MEHRRLRGAPNTVVARGAERIAGFIRSTSAWLRFGGTADFAHRTNSRTHIGPAGMRKGAIGATIKAFSGKVDTGFPQKMRPLKESRARSDST